ncbi:MAG TPA: 23S rRNA (pseudouridine(1915)-N(3))-methyltransferase RlmH, partial [Candidatus Gracilibacteria bacterium]|nr:23S rRNA (pseudouridine(1915)-N(3))-methyltransferase RlmH [Candidatus Gracilibacteria bacterium]
MKIFVIQVGKTKTAFLQEAEQEYMKRLRPYADFEVITVKDWGSLERAVAVKKEGDEIAEALARPQMKGCFRVCLDERGKL